jgi:WD40 repeat protein
MENFSEVVPFSGPLPSFSRNKRYLASARDNRLEVRCVEDLAVVGLFSCLGRIEALAWSPDSDHVLCGLYKRDTVEVFSVADPTFSCTIFEGAAGVVSAQWSPDGKHILLVADFCIKLSVWSLVDRQCLQLRGPKSESSMAFSPDGTLLAVAEVRLHRPGAPQSTAAPACSYTPLSPCLGQ